MIDKIKAMVETTRKILAWAPARPDQVEFADKNQSATRQSDATLSDISRAMAENSLAGQFGIAAGNLADQLGNAAINTVSFLVGSKYRI